MCECIRLMYGCSVQKNVVDEVPVLYCSYSIMQFNVNSFVKGIFILKPGSSFKDKQYIKLIRATIPPQQTFN
jgi:hypothetical protein